MTQQEHLQLIRARCVELLEIAEKRTAGVWEHGEHTVWSDDRMVADADFDAAFIASCAGAAEAGWRATIEVIDLASRETGDDVPYNTFDRILDSITSAWPIELLNNK